VTPNEYRSERRDRGAVKLDLLLKTLEMNPRDVGDREVCTVKVYPVRSSEVITRTLDPGRISGVDPNGVIKSMTPLEESAVTSMLETH
jgi:hypothetical protein